MRAGVGHSSAGNARTAAAEATAAALAQAGLSRARGAFVFASSGYSSAYPLILRTVAAEAGTAEVVGCSALGVIAGEHELESKAALAVMVVGGEGIEAHRLFVPSLRSLPDSGGVEVATWARPLLGAQNLLCLLVDSYNANPQTLVTALERDLPGVAVVGGGATEDGRTGETSQFCGDTVSSNALAAMLLSGDFEVDVGVSLACTPLGPTHTVTAVRNNIIVELDGRPAFELFAQAAGALVQDPRRAVAFVFLATPFDRDVERLSPGNYLVRNILGFSAESGVVAVACHPLVGDRVGFALRDATGARNDLKATLEAMRSRLKGTPAFGLYFDCVSRGSGLYGIAGHDSAYIRRYFGDFPVAGFFTGFEIGVVRGAAEVLQYTGVLALVSRSGT